MKPIIFAGPSLNGVDKLRFKACDFAPPAIAGDILRAVAAGRRVIGLIDGAFEAGPAVWHKEIHAALYSGCVVYGASSIGALRAAEMNAIGMIGVGRIFEEYLSGHRTSDSDVALIYGPPELDWPPLSIPLVDCENTLNELSSARAISRDECQLMCDTARSLFFKTRSWSKIIKFAVESEVRQNELLNLVPSNFRSLKRLDALALIKNIEDQAQSSSTVIPRYIETKFIQELKRRSNIE